MAKKTTTKLTNRVTLVKTNRTTRELGLVVMSVGFFCRVSLHLSFVEKNVQVVEKERVRGSQNGECEGEERLNPGLSAFIEQSTNGRRQRAMAPSRRSSRRASGAG